MKEKKCYTATDTVYNQRSMKNSRLYILIILLAALLSGTVLLNSSVPEDGVSEPAVTETEETELTETDEAVQEETEEKKEQKKEKLVYEAVFLESEDVEEVFRDIRGDDAPYENVPANFHVTVYYKPDQWMQQFYGKKVSVVCTRYQAGEVPGRDGMTANEGILAELVSDDLELQSYLDASEDQCFHITGSYKDVPKYTMYLDFSGGKEISYTLEGTFGAYIDGGRIRLSPEESGTGGQ